MFNVFKISDIHQGYIYCEILLILLLLFKISVFYLLYFTIILIYWFAA